MLAAPNHGTPKGWFGCLATSLTGLPTAIWAATTSTSGHTAYLEARPPSRLRQDLPTNYGNGVGLPDSEVIPVRYPAGGQTMAWGSHTSLREQQMAYNNRHSIKHPKNTSHHRRHPGSPIQCWAWASTRPCLPRDHQDLTIPTRNTHLGRYPQPSTVHFTAGFLPSPTARHKRLGWTC
jgi:hypothetical protein